MLKRSTQQRIDIKTYALSSLLYSFCEGIAKFKQDNTDADCKAEASINLILQGCVAFEGMVMSYIAWNSANSVLGPEIDEQRIATRDEFFKNAYWQKSEKFGLKGAFHKYFNKNIEHVLGKDLFCDLSLTFELRHVLAHGRDIDIISSEEVVYEYDDAEEKEFKEWVKSSATRRHVDKGYIKKKTTRDIGCCANLFADLYAGLIDRGLITVKDEIYDDACGNDSLNFDNLFSDKVALFCWKTIVESKTKIESTFEIDLNSGYYRKRIGYSKDIGP